MFKDNKCMSIIATLIVNITYLLLIRSVVYLTKNTLKLSPILIYIIISFVVVVVVNLCATVSISMYIVSMKSSIISTSIILTPSTIVSTLYISFLFICLPHIYTVKCFFLTSQKQHFVSTNASDSIVKK